MWSYKEYPQKWKECIMGGVHENRTTCGCNWSGWYSSNALDLYAVGSWSEIWPQNIQTSAPNLLLDLVLFMPSHQMLGSALIGYRHSLPNSIQFVTHPATCHYNYREIVMLLTVYKIVSIILPPLLMSSIVDISRDYQCRFLHNGSHAGWLLCRFWG
jgi:hypothetical protein